MVAEFDQVVFGDDTGEMDMGSGSYIFEPTYALDEVHGPGQVRLPPDPDHAQRRQIRLPRKEGVYDSQASLNEN